jgi:Flp pilus assembly pilin Flp
MLEYILRKLRPEGGQALVEYALVVSLIALVCVAALTFLGQEIDAMLSQLPGFTP